MQYNQLTSEKVKHKNYEHIAETVTTNKAMVPTVKITTITTAAQKNTHINQTSALKGKDTQQNINLTTYDLITMAILRMIITRPWRSLSEVGEGPGNASVFHTVPTLINISLRCYLHH